MTAPTKLWTTAFALLWLLPITLAGQDDGHDPSHQMPADAHQVHAPPDESAEPLPPFVPALTDADRRAAFPDVGGHRVHDEAIHYFVLADEFEWQADEHGPAIGWDGGGWIGRDLDRFWFRTEGAWADERLDHAEAHLLYGRAVARWWEVVAGLRQDLRPGRAQTWAMVGVQGLAPYWFEIEASAYLGAGGRTQVRFEAEYELLLTNRLVLQPSFDVDLFGRADPARRRGAGLSSTEAGVRLRYEIRRELAPYVGVSWHRAFFGTADAARTAGEPVGDARLVVGVRLWQ